MLSDILTGLSPKISIERLYPAVEPRSVMLRSEHLDSPYFLGIAIHASDTGSLAIAAHGISQAVVHRLRVHQRLHESLAVTKRQI